MDNKTILAILDENPELRERVTQLLSTVVNEGGNIELADEAEQRVIDQLRLMGHDALQAWANHQTKVVGKRAQQQKPNLRKHEKKSLCGTPPMEKSR
jgi:hypothetical protein